MGRQARIWWQTIRPWSYTAAVIPVVLGAVIAAYDGYFDAGLLLLVIVGSVAIQMGTNLSNE